VSNRICVDVAHAVSGIFSNNAALAAAAAAVGLVVTGQVGSLTLGSAMNYDTIEQLIYRYCSFGANNN